LREQRAAVRDHDWYPRRSGVPPQTTNHGGQGRLRGAGREASGAMPFIYNPERFGA
jgi:hypothetical protein